MADGNIGCENGSDSISGDTCSRSYDGDIARIPGTLPVLTNRRALYAARHPVIGPRTTPR